MQWRRADDNGVRDGGWQDERGGIDGFDKGMLIAISDESPGYEGDDIGTAVAVCLQGEGRGA